MAEEEITVTLTVQVRTFDTPARAKHQVSEETLRRLSLSFGDVQVTEAYVGSTYVPARTHEPLPACDDCLSRNYIHFSDTPHFNPTPPTASATRPLNGQPITFGTAMAQRRTMDV